MSREYNIIIEDHNFAYIPEPYPEIIKALSTKYKKFNRKSKSYFFKYERFIEGGQFLTGLVPYIVNTFPNDSFLIDDQRQFPVIERFNIPHLTKTLRKYQIDYVMEAIKRDRAILKAETGSGKTLMIAALIGTFPFRVLLIAPGKDVADQLHKDLSELLPHKNISRDIKNINDPQIDCLIGLSRSLHNRYSNTDYFKGFPVVLMDEAHCSPSRDNMHTILKSGAPFRYGFTATPYGRSDHRDLLIQGLFGEIIEYVDHKVLKEQGYHPEMDVQMFYNSYAGNYTYMEDVLIVNNPVRNKRIVELALEERRKGGCVLILTSRKDHGKILRKMIFNSLYIDGDSSMEERERAKQKLIDGKVHILISSQIFAQGVNIPNITLGINAAGGKADIINKQRIGRIARPFEGKVKKFIDFIDDYSWTTQTHSTTRLAAYMDLYQHVQLIDSPPDKEKKIMEKARELLIEQGI